MATEDLPVLAVPQLPELAAESVKGIIDELPWMKDVKISLLYKRKDIEAFIDRCISKGMAAFDLETTGLSTRPDKEKISSAPLVGVGIAISRDEGVYIPVAHEDNEYNVSLTFLIPELKRLAANCVLIFHNFKYDGQILRNYGILVGGEQCDPTKYEDTLILVSVQDASRKVKGLKDLSLHLLNREMLNIKNLGVTVNTKNVPAFDQVPPEKAIYYAVPDVLNTYYLYEVLSDMVDKQDPTGKGGPWGIYRKIEKPCMFVTMEMERNHVLVDLEYLKSIRLELIKRCKHCVSVAHKAAGRPFDLNSPKQLGTILFEEFKLPYPGKKETKSGGYETSEAILEKIKSKHPIIEAILDFRHYEKQLKTYVENLINNADQDGMVRFELNQTKADTGRYTATGGKGLDLDGYCGVNCQNLPRVKKNDPKSLDIRKALIARPGFKIVTVDYSGEELRIAANLSRERKWINEFLNGTGDLHTITAQIIHNKSEVSKEERGLGKTLNFLTLYGGGAMGFSAQAKVPIERAKIMINNFFKQYQGISSWIKTEVAKGRKRGYSKTAFGRRRPISAFYLSGDKAIASKGDRCIINSAVQGSAADVMKIALHRVSKWIRENGLNDKIRILLPIHDEIVYEIANDGTPEGEAAFGRYIEELSEIMKMKDIVQTLGWPVLFEVDAEYGSSLSITNDYFKEKAKLEENSDKSVTTAVEEKSPKEAQEIVAEEKLEEVSEIVKQQLERPIQINDNASDSVASDKKTKQDDSNVKMETVSYDSSGISFKAMVISQLDETVKEDKAEVVEDEGSSVEIKNEKIRELIDKRGYLEWPITNCNAVIVAQLTSIFKILKNMTPVFSGPECRIKLVSNKGEILYKSEEKVSIDAFLFAAMWINL